MGRYDNNPRDPDYQEDQARQARVDRGEERYIENMLHVPPAPPKAAAKPTPDLYPVGPGAGITRCKKCPARIAWVPGVNPGKMIPASIDSPFAIKEGTRTVAAPSHFTDCPEAKSFSKGGKKA